MIIVIIAGIVVVVVHSFCQTNFRLAKCRLSVWLGGRRHVGVGMVAKVSVAACALLFAFTLCKCVCVSCRYYRLSRDQP